MKGAVRLISHIDPIPEVTDHSKDDFLLDHFWFRKISARSRNSRSCQAGFAHVDSPAKPLHVFSSSAPRSEISTKGVW